MGSHNPFGYLKHVMAQKKGRKSNCQFDSRPLKSRIALISLCVGGMPHIDEKLSMKVTIFLQISFQSKVRTRSYGPPKSREVQFQEFWDSQLGNPGTKWHLGAGPVAKHREYYKGGRWLLPPSSGHGEFCESIFAYGSSVHQRCSNYAFTNLLFGLCKFIWIIDFLVICRNPHLGVLARPSTPEMLWDWGVPQLLILPLFSPWDLQLNLSRSLGVRHLPIISGGKCKIHNFFKVFFSK
jgi:hypothetical protein